MNFNADWTFQVYINEWKREEYGAVVYWQLPHRKNSCEHVIAIQGRYHAADLSAMTFWSKNIHQLSIVQELLLMQKNHYNYVMAEKKMATLPEWN